MKVVKIGLLGLGNVGGGAYRILSENGSLIAQRTGTFPQVVKILQRNRNKKRIVSVPAHLLTEDPDDIINSSDIDIVAEMIGGIEPATSFMLQAMKAGKHVVSANKAAIAANYDLLTRTAAENGVEFLFEASVCGGIPVLNAIQESLQANRFTRISGILNGTTNYILTKMTEENSSYAEALADAQAKGFAEADPTADVEGIDAANKLSILMALAFGVHVAPEDIPTTGITSITPGDIAKAASSGKKIKLLGQAFIRPDGGKGRGADCDGDGGDDCSAVGGGGDCGADCGDCDGDGGGDCSAVGGDCDGDGGGDCRGTLEYSVSPVSLPADHPLAGVNNEFNAVYITGDMAGEVMLYGRGAGPLPTGSAICGDIIKILKTRFA